MIVVNAIYNWRASPNFIWQVLLVATAPAQADGNCGQRVLTITAGSYC